MLRKRKIKKVLTKTKKVAKIVAGTSTIALLAVNAYERFKK